MSQLVIEAPRSARAESIAPAAAPQLPEVSLRNWLAVFGAALGAFMAVLDIQIVNSSLQNIQGALGATLDEGTWIATSYLVAEIITIPLTSWLSRVFSTRFYVMVNACLFIVFSMCCAWAHDLNSMIIFRALQGFTGGILIPMSMTVILKNLPPHKRPVGMALFSVTATFAPSIGPALGGWLTDTFGWQYIFYLNLLPGIAFLSILWFTLDREPMRLDLLKTGDWFGVVSMSIGLACLEIVLEEGNRKDWFGSTLILRLAIVSVVALGLFLWRQFTAKNPLINLRLLRNRNFGLGSVANTALGIGLYGSVYIVPVYLAQMQGYDAWQIGQVMMWLGLPQLVLIPMVPLLMKHIDSRLMVAIGVILFAASCFMNTSMTYQYGGPQLIAALLVRSIGQPLIMVPLSTLTNSTIPAAEAGNASALFNMMRNMGGSVGVAVISTFITRREAFHGTRLGEHVVATSLPFQQQVNGLTSYLVSRGADAVQAQQQALQLIDHTLQREAFTMAFNDAFLIMGLLLLISCAAVVFMKKSDITQAPAGVH